MITGVNLLTMTILMTSLVIFLYWSGLNSACDSDFACFLGGKPFHKRVNTKFTIMYNVTICVIQCP